MIETNNTLNNHNQRCSTSNAQERNDAGRSPSSACHLRYLEYSSCLPTYLFESSFGSFCCMHRDNRDKFIALSSNEMMTKVFLILSVIALLHGGQTAKILGVFEFNGKSHFQMYEKMMKGLAERGHEVHVLNHFPQKKPLPNYFDIDVSGSVPDVLDSFTIDLVRTWDTTAMLSFIWDLTRTQCKDVLKHPNAQKLLNSTENVIPPIWEIAKNTSLILVNSHFSISGPRPVVPGFVEVGGLHIEEPKALPKDLQKFMDESEHGVVYFSLGSIVQVQTFSPEKLKALMDAFGALPERVLMKYTGDTLPGKPSNVMTGKWLPQLDILSHPKTRLFISHGGLMGTLEAVYAGVPIVGIPLFADQELNIKRCVLQGFAVKLLYDDITKESLLSAIRTLLDDPRYSANAKKTSFQFRDRPQTALETAVYWVEYVIRHRGAPHLRSAGADLPTYQYLLLDVISVLVLGVVSFLYLTYIVIRTQLGDVLTKPPLKLLAGYGLGPFPLRTNAALTPLRPASVAQLANVLASCCARIPRTGRSRIKSRSVHIPSTSFYFQSPLHHFNGGLMKKEEELEDERMEVFLVTRRLEKSTKRKHDYSRKGLNVIQNYDSKCRNHDT
uniref:UDP-glycosyltransferase n=1 Tax=Timema douglasi TaxID=61478 RepID=A0A7R8VIU6_TIMDO|nr:unnamed protein product [Timema douglasi]